jgi:hypothetical protein
MDIDLAKPAARRRRPANGSIPESNALDFREKVSEPLARTCQSPRAVR